MGEAGLKYRKLASGCENKVMRNNPWVVITHTLTHTHTGQQHSTTFAELAWHTKA